MNPLTEQDWMVKCHAQDDQEALFKACGGHMNFLLDVDSRVKSASSDVITRQIISEFKPPKGHFAQHMIIMGDGEAYGANRNGDYWSKQANLTRHPTFVTEGAYYREHNHKRRDLAIGDVKYAAYNPAMARVELIVWGNIKKANDIFESLKKGEARSNSMSARVKFDVCSCCNQKSPSPQYYCKHAAEKMNQWVPEFQKYAYVDNPNPTYFDASDVGYPADRLAHYIEYAFPDEDMKKAASANRPVITGVDWAKFYGADEYEHHNLKLNSWQTRMMEKMAAHEQWISDNVDSSSDNAKVAFVRNIAPLYWADELTDEEIHELRHVRPPTFFGKMAKSASILPFRSFLSYATGRTMKDLNSDPCVKFAAEKILPQLFRQLVKNGCACQAMDPEVFSGDSAGTISVDPGVTDPVNKLMGKLGQKYTGDPEAVKARVIRITIIKSGSTKRGNYPEVVSEFRGPDEEGAQFLAGVYGMYKLAAFQTMSDYGVPITEPMEVLFASSQFHQ